MLCPEFSFPLLLSVSDCVCVSIVWARYIKNAYTRIQTWTKKQKAVLKAPFEVWLTTRKALARSLSCTCSNPNYQKTDKKWQQVNRFVMHTSLLASFSFTLSTSLRYTALQILLSFILTLFVWFSVFLHLQKAYSILPALAQQVHVTQFPSFVFVRKSKWTYCYEDIKFPSFGWAWVWHIEHEYGK